MKLPAGYSHHFGPTATHPAASKFLIYKRHHYADTAPQAGRYMDDVIRHTAGELEGQPIEFASYSEASRLVSLLNSVSYACEPGELKAPTLTIMLLD